MARRLGMAFSLAGAIALVFFLTKVEPSSESEEEKPPAAEAWTPPVFGNDFSVEQRAACDVMVARVIRFSGLAIERRSSEVVFFHSPWRMAGFTVDCGRWPGANAHFSESAMPPRDFFVLVGVFGAAVTSASSDQIEKAASTCQERALSRRNGNTIELPIAGGTLQCSSFGDAIDFSIQPPTVRPSKATSRPH